MKNDLIERDLKHIWHPCSQMKDYELFPPLEISHANGSILTLRDGRQIIDAISSWWCKSLGHNHPALKQALLDQAEKFGHVILANTTNETIATLGEKLATLSPGLDKMLFASDGSCAVEMAMKMSVHARKIQREGQVQRTKFMALSNGYHGETCLTLSVSDLGIYKDAYKSLLIDTPFVRNIPYVSGEHDPLWEDCSEYWPAIEAQLETHADTLTAIIFEPIVQGAGGMLIYSKDFLKRLRAWTKKHDIHLIADEIMTGIGRTGYALACEHAGIQPDFLCLSKGLTGGMLPLSAMLTSTDMYNLFYDDYETGNSFLHSHTHSGNALAAAVAIACLDTIEREKIYQTVRDNAPFILKLMTEIKDETNAIKNIRSIGGIVAADLIVDDPKERKGFKVYQKAVELGALLRPLGNTIYWIPPLNTPRETLEKLQRVTSMAISSIN
jgi:adenosylmethionine-8-amino-7-oxononanoate aminotransferase